MVTTSASAAAGAPREGIKAYYKTKIEELEAVINGKTQDLRRLEAQRNQLNAKGRWMEVAAPCSSLADRSWCATAAALCHCRRP